MGSFPWITRVPVTIGGTRELILAVSGEWFQTRPETAYTVLGATYDGIKQRWLVVYTRAAHEWAEQTVNNRHLKQSHAESQAFQTLTTHSFACVADAEAALTKFQKTLKVVALHEPQIIAVPGFNGKGRPAKNRAPDTIRYHITASIASVLETRQTSI